MTEETIQLQPKQLKVLELIEDSPAKVIGVGGGRGAAKSAGADRIALSLMMEQPGMLGCIVMRNYDQVRKYHIEPMLRAFPALDPFYNRSNSNLAIPVGDKVSQLDFSYAESLVDVERRFRSANYRYIIVDQAEQFTEPEIREMRKANRSPGGVPSKMILLFNMGGAGIQTLRKWFHTREFNERETPSDYAFVHVFPWDNVEWVRSELEEDGLSVRAYYSWSDNARMEYAASRGEYTRQLNSEDDAIRARDWFGSWESLEGAYFGKVFSRQDTMISDGQAKKLIKPWDKRWMSQDWGKAHFCSTHWHAKTLIAPSEAREILGWEIEKPLNAVITYRRLIVNEMSSHDVGTSNCGCYTYWRARTNSFLLSIPRRLW